MSVTPEPIAERIAHHGRQVLVTRLRSAFADETQRSSGVAMDGDELERRIADACERAGASLWRRSLAQAAIAELGIDLPSAIEHPEVIRAHELVGAPLYEPPAAPAADAGSEVDALRIPAIHIGGIAALRAGERDIELRFSDAGLDVLKRSTGAPVGHLESSDISVAELRPPRRGLRAGRRRAHELHVETARGRASFELPGLTQTQLKEHLEPLLARALANRG